MKERYIVCKMKTSEDKLIKLSRQGLEVSVDENAHDYFIDKQQAKNWILNNQQYFIESKPVIIEYYTFD